MACGLGTVIDFLKQWRFSAADLSYLKELRAPDQSPYFPKIF